MNNQIKCVVFDCDGVLVDSVSSWRTLHSFFGTENHDLLQKFISGEITDQEFMSLDIKMWKDVQPKIHQDDIFRAYSGIKLMPGARETVSELISRGIYVAIVSAGVDIFVSTIASTLKVDDWIANGFYFDDEGYLLDEGIVRVRGEGKDKIKAIPTLVVGNGLILTGAVRRFRRRRMLFLEIKKNINDQNFYT